MRLFFVCLTVVCLLFLLLSCTPTASRNPFAYADTAFSVTVEGTYLPAGDAEGTPRPFSAEIAAGAPVNGDPTLRDLTVTFTSPDTLAGLTVTATLSTAPDGTVERVVSMVYPSEYGDVASTVEGTGLDGLLRFAEALLPFGDTAAIYPKAAGGSYTVIRKAQGREATFSFTHGLPFPTRITVATPREILELAVLP